MRNLKRKIIMCLLFISLFVINISCVSAVTTDINAPTVSNLVFEQKENLKPGDKVYLDTDMKDDVSGIETVYLVVGKILLNDGKYYNNVEDVRSSLVVYFDEEKPYVIIPDTYLSGTYYVKEIEMFDKEDNRSWFYTKDQIQYYKEMYDDTINSSAGLTLEEGITFDAWLDNFTANFEPFRTNISVTFNVVSGDTDTESPYMAAFSLSKEKINYSESTNVQLKIEDNSHYMYVSIGLSNGAVINQYFDDTTSSMASLYYKPTSKNDIGIIYVDYVILKDMAGNLAFYLREGYQGDLAVSYYQNVCKRCETLPELKFEVIDDGSIDEVAPTLVDVRINNTEFPVPSFAKIELEATDDKALANEAYVVFKSGNKELNATLYLDDDGIYKGELNISQYAELGKYKLTDVVISDLHGNSLLYCNYDYKYKDKDLDVNLEFELVSNVEANVTTSTISNELLEKIKNAKDDDNIAIDATGNSIVKKEIFDAIKGTNKTIHIESNGIEWIFNGNDIKETKDIDVSLLVYYDYNYKNFDTDKYSGKALILKFAPNGELPGVAKVRIKLDYTLRNYIGEEVYVYYYDENDNSKMFSDIVGDSIKMTDSGWFEFSIDHNSAYVFTNTKPKEEYVKKDDELIKINTISNNIIEEDNTFDLVIIIILVVILLVIIALLVCFKNIRKNNI